MDIAKAVLAEYGLVICASCGAELVCDHETGDMPDNCPCCQKIIDWGGFLHE